MDKPVIKVLGAGAVGLAAAFQLQQKLPSADITLIADEFSGETTSCGAAGIFRPTLHHTRGNDESRIRRWTKDSWDYFYKLSRSADAAENGVILIALYDVSQKITPRGLYADYCLDYHELTTEQAQKFGSQFKYGFTASTLVTQCEFFLPWLMRQFKERGGKVERRTVHSFQEFVGKCDVVVNCSGIGSRKLLGDTRVYPVRGQVLRVHAPWIKGAVYENSGDGVYIIPCVNSVVVGGSREVNNFSQVVNEEQSEDIFRKACEFYPPLKGAKILRSWAGLRPHREPIRLEKEVMNFDGSKLKVVHNYGHGANGVCLSWGTSKEATELVEEFLSRPDLAKL